MYIFQGPIFLHFKFLIKIIFFNKNSIVILILIQNLLKI